MKNTIDNTQRTKIQGKKAQLEYVMQNVFRIGFAICAVIIFFVIINYYVNNKIDTNLLQEETLTNRILYGNSIMYQDPTTARIYPGIVDVIKFKSGSIDASIDYGEYKRHAAAKITLTKKPPASSQIAQTYLNKDNFENLQQLLNTRGKGSATYYEAQYPVAYKDFAGNDDYGTLTVEIIIPNS
jgi:hypothetical protein